MLRQSLSRIALALIACLWASLAFGQVAIPPDSSSQRFGITSSNTGTTLATGTSLAAVQGKTTYICGWSVSADATGATETALTVTGTVTGTMNYRMSVAALANGTAQTSQTYTPCIPASAPNTAISVNAGAAGAGGNEAVSAWGFQF